MSVLFSTLLLILFPLNLLIRRRRVKRECILEVDFSHGLKLREHVSGDPITKLLFYNNSMSIFEFFTCLEKAGLDKRVSGLVCYLGNGSYVTTLGLAAIQELRESITNFSRKGKFTCCFSNSFGEGFNGIFAYYLATAFEQVYLQPSGELNFAGLIIEQPFVKRFLEKLGLVPYLESRKEYKNMKNLFTETKFTDEHKEAVAGVLEVVIQEITDEIIARRRIAPEDLKKLIEGIFLSSEEAKKWKLIDDAIYLHQFYELDFIRNRNLLFLQHYYKNPRDFSLMIPKCVYKRVHSYFPWLARRLLGSPRVALIYLRGSILTGKGVPGRTSGSDCVSKALLSACEDERISAILLRVDTGGGSYVASDAISAVVAYAAQTAKKPVVVSMGNVAASGGYFVSCRCSRIVAHPLTLTGSIGVVFGKFGTTQLWNKLGVDWDDLNTHENATFFTGIF
ncbi:uncharacterized protein LOC135121327 [Zophobas morio]|uniref:uncharacterized protein LOC135121327 n=1 Tax=Zophobas morio TaxID=2755281 RepID=UPI003082BB94